MEYNVNELKECSEYEFISQRLDMIINDVCNDMCIYIGRNKYLTIDNIMEYMKELLVYGVCEIDVNGVRVKGKYTLFNESTGMVVGLVHTLMTTYTNLMIDMSDETHSKDQLVDILSYHHQKLQLSFWLRPTGPDEKYYRFISRTQNTLRIFLDDIVNTYNTYNG